MRAAFPTPSSDWRRPSARQRATAIALTLAAELVFLILLLGLVPSVVEQFEAPGEPISFDLAPPTPQAKTPERKATAAKRGKAWPPKRRPQAPPGRKVRLPKSHSSSSARRRWPRRRSPSSATAA